MGAAALLLVTIIVGCSVEEPQNRADEEVSTQWSPEDAAYVLPTEIPNGWTLGVATQRIEVGELPDGEAVEFGDYTLSWVPDENAGRDRDSVNRDGPGFWINSGSRYYEDVYWPAILGDTESRPPIGAYDESTPFTRDGDRVELVFRVECCLVALGATGIDDSTLRQIAARTVAFELDEWQNELGDRLLVDDQT